MLASDAVWYNDVRALVRRPSEFFPMRDQSPEERVNAIVRLIVYCTAAVVVYRRKWKYVLFGLGAVALVSMAYRGSAVTSRGGFKGGRTGGRPYSASHRTAGYSTTATTGGTVVDARLPERRDASVGGLIPPHSLRMSTKCTLSTPDNPFANMLLSDLADRPGRAPACKYDDQADLIRQNFNRGLVRNAYDVYEKENSQRQWMTMPVTTSTPDTVAFAHFCYGNAGRKTCKEDPSKCTGAFP